MKNETSIVLKDIRKTYYWKGIEIVALDGISLKIMDGEHVCVTGCSGSGKTTLAKIISGIEIPTTGEITIYGERLFTAHKMEKKNLCSTVQYVQQDSYRSFDPLYTIFSAFDECLKYKEKGTSAKERKQRIESLVSMSKMDDLTDNVYKYPKELSGGQLQRFAFLRSMILSPRILVADEPTAMLDDDNTQKIIRLFNNYLQECTLIYITHDRQLANILSDRHIVLNQGKIICDDCRCS